MKYFIEIIKKNKSMVACYILLGTTIAFLNNYSTQYFKRLIDTFGSDDFKVGTIIGYGVLLLFLCIANYVHEYPSCKLDTCIYLDFKLMALKKISKIDYESHQSLGTGMLIQRIENGAHAGKRILFNFIFCLISQLIPSMFFSLYFIGKMSQVIIVYFLVGYVFVFLLTKWLLRYLYHIKERILVNEEVLNKFLIRGFMELVVFRMNRRFEAELTKAERAGEEITHSKIKLKLIHEGFFASFAVLIVVIKIIIIIYGWQTKSLSIGTIIALITLVDNAYTPIAIFNVLFVQYKLDQTTFNRYLEFLNMKDDEGLIGKEELADLEGLVTVQHLSFSYQNQDDESASNVKGRRLILDDLCLNFTKGKMTALVGESGSGKSTLIKILLGLLKPTKGSVLIDGEPLSKINLRAYYEKIAYISQESPVFDGTLRENLVFDKDIEDTQLISALEQVGLGEFFMKLEKGLDTKIGEKGLMLSGGERQRLVLARLHFTSAHLIILDEATSAMDNLTERLVMSHIIEILKGKTVIIIAHRLTSIQNVDQVILFKEGRVLGQGKFEELLQHNEYFKALAKTYSKEDELRSI